MERFFIRMNCCDLKASNGILLLAVAFGMQCVKFGSTSEPIWRSKGNEKHISKPVWLSLFNENHLNIELNFINHLIIWSNAGSNGEHRANNQHFSLFVSFFVTDDWRLVRMMKNGVDVSLIAIKHHHLWLRYFPHLLFT